VADILIIDDDADNCELLTRALTRAGHAPRCAEGYREAMKALVASTPDLVVLDVLMPAMDGVTLLEVIRSSSRWVFLPVVILTAYPEDPRLTEVAALGVNRVFAKAKYDLNDLLGYVGGRAAGGAGTARPGTLA
jgi:CheY-like chemotaxis protein